MSALTAYRPFASSMTASAPATTLRGDTSVGTDEHRHRRAVGAERGACLEALVEQDERRKTFRPRALRVARRDDDETRSHPIRRRLPGEHVFVHRPAEAAVGVPEEEQRVVAAQRGERDCFAFQRGQLDGGGVCSDRKTLALGSPAAVCSTSCSIHSLPAATQLPIVPSGAITSTALGVPFASYASYSRVPVVEEHVHEPVLLRPRRPPRRRFRRLASDDRERFRVIALPRGDRRARAPSTARSSGS